MQKTKTTVSVPAKRLAVLIMAAGKGTRLKSKHPKVLHEVGGQPLIAHVIRAAKKVVPPGSIYVVIGCEADRVREAVAYAGVNFVLQSEQRGTGHAVMMASEALANYSQVIVLSGDAPLITPKTIGELRDFHIAKQADMTILTAELADPSGYGRVVRAGAKSSNVRAIVEHKSAGSKQQRIREINAGIYSFAVKPLLQHLTELKSNNAHGEFYLTDMAAIFAKAKLRVIALRAEDPNEVLGGNTRAELVDIDQYMRAAKCRELMAAGVTIFYPQTCVIDVDVEAGEDTTIEPFVQLLGTTRIGADCRIRSYSVIRNSEIADAVTVLPGCVIDDSRVGAKATLGPYSRLRPGSDIGEGAHLGNFVEIKKTRMGKGSKANHLTYLGDAEIGEGVNIGAGTILCNYDGMAKHKTIIEDGVFVGSDSTLVAPVKVGKGAYVAAASCITDEVPPDALAIGRSRQIVKEGWAKQKREALVRAQKAK